MTVIGWTAFLQLICKVVWYTPRLAYIHTLGPSPSVRSCQDFLLSPGLRLLPRASPRHSWCILRRDLDPHTILSVISKKCVVNVFAKKSFSSLGFVVACIVGKLGCRRPFWQKLTTISSFMSHKSHVVRMLIFNSLVFIMVPRHQIT